MPTSRRASRNGLITIGASRPRSAIEWCGKGGVGFFIEISIFAPAIAAGIGVALDRLRICRSLADRAEALGGTISIASQVDPSVHTTCAAPTSSPVRRSPATQRGAPSP
jgi:hypothetical protein